MKSGTWQMPVFFLGLTMGTASTLLVKAVYQTQSVGSDGQPKFFEKPIIMTFLMFLGMAFALPLYYAIVYFKRRSAASARADAAEMTRLTKSSSRQFDVADPFGDDSSSAHSSYQSTPSSMPVKGSGAGSRLEALLSSSPQLPSSDGDADAEDAVAVAEADADPLDDPRALLDLRLNMILLIPSLFDLVGTALSTIGLLYTSVSIYQLSRCTVIVVTGVLKAFVLGHRLSRNQWAGIATNAVAMLLVGSTAFFEGSAASAEVPTGGADVGSGNYGDARVGILFILASCLVQGAQYVFEEKVMAFDSVPPLILVGMEGVWGVIMFLIAVFPAMALIPGADNGRYEDCWEGIQMMFGNTQIFVLLLSFTVIVFLYNVFCIYITYLLSSVWHAIMDNCRPVAVWVIGMFFYYTLGRIGEPWTSSSWLELAGMLLLFYGTAVYNGNLTFPGVSRSDEYEKIPSDDGSGVGEVSPLYAGGVRDALPATPMFMHRAAAGSSKFAPAAAAAGAGAGAGDHAPSMADMLTRSPMVLAKQGFAVSALEGGLSGSHHAHEPKKPHFLSTQAQNAYTH